MGVFTVLKSVGSKFELGVEKALALETKALPAEQEVAAAVTLVNPVIGAGLSQFVAVIASVEQIATAVGASNAPVAQKIAAALPGIEKSIESDPLFAGKKIADAAKYNAAVVAFATAISNLTDSFVSSTAPVAVPGTSGSAPTA